MTELHYSDDAIGDLDEIYNYIRVELENPVAAENTIAKITKRVRGLELFAEMGALLSSVVDYITDYRFLVCGNYLAFYRIIDGDVYINRILHGKRDYVSALFGELS
jgi:plasmid stabilization system protein ParE